MAITYDTYSYVAQSSLTPTVSHTVAAQSNSILLVWTVSYNSDTYLCSGVTYNGVSMTQVGSKKVNGTGYNVMYCFALPIASPDGSAHNIVATWNNNSTYVVMGTSYYGVKQAQPEANGNAATTNSTTWAGSVTTVTDNAFVVCGFRAQGTSTCTDGTDTTKRFAYQDGQNAIIEYSSNPKATAGSQTLNVSGCGKNAAWGNVGILVSIAPYVPSGPANLKSYNTNLKANIKSINTNLIANVKTLNTNA